MKFFGKTSSIPEVTKEELEESQGNLVPTLKVLKEFVVSKGQGVVPCSVCNGARDGSCKACGGSGTATDWR